jgi:hypothetical protein
MDVKITTGNMAMVSVEAMPYRPTLFSRYATSMHMYPYHGGLYPGLVSKKVASTPANATRKLSRKMLRRRDLYRWAMSVTVAGGSIKFVNSLERTVRVIAVVL